MSATGADWTFGPTVAVPRDVHWGRSYEGYGEDPEIVAAYAGPMTLGLQGELVPGQPLDRTVISLGSVKHFLGEPERHAAAGSTRATPTSPRPS